MRESICSVWALSGFQDPDLPSEHFINLIIVTFHLFIWHLGSIFLQSIEASVEVRQTCDDYGYLGWARIFVHCFVHPDKPLQVLQDLIQKLDRVSSLCNKLEMRSSVFAEHLHQTHCLRFQVVQFACNLVAHRTRVPLTECHGFECIPMGDFFYHDICIVQS